MFRFPAGDKQTQFQGGQTTNDNATSTASGNGKALNQTIAKQPASVNIYDVKILDKNQNVIFTQQQESAVNATGFSIQAASLPDRFAGHPLAERMSNFMRTEARRYERTLNLNSPDNAAVNAIAATQAIIHSLDKYVRNGEFRLPREAITRLKHMRALIEKYAQMMKSGKIRSFAKIDKAEQSELLAAMAEAAADIDMDSINAMTPEEFEALRSEVAAELMPELYRKHARSLA